MTHAGSRERGRERRPLGAPLRALVAGACGGAAFVALLGYRTDYAGHFLAGFGGTLGLLAVPLALCTRPLRWSPLVTALLAIGLGAIAEATVFRIAIFDPVDFFDQSLGAALAAASAQGRTPSRTAGALAVLLALLFLAAGTLLAFA